MGDSSPSKNKALALRQTFSQLTKGDSPEFAESPLNILTCKKPPLQTVKKISKKINQNYSKVFDSDKELLRGLGSNIKHLCEDVSDYHDESPMSSYRGGRRDF